MSVLSAIRDVTSVLNVVVLAVGYYSLVKLYREWVSQWKEERAAGGRPQVVVTTDYSHLPTVNVVVRNFTKAPAKDVTFDFSAPVENPLPRARREDQLPLGLHAVARAVAQREGAQGEHTSNNQV